MNTDDLSHSFQTPEFLETLANYEEMVRQHRTCYFESNDLILLAEYYAAQQKSKNPTTLSNTRSPFIRITWNSRYTNAIP